MSAYQQPVNCPFCGTPCDNAEFVDIEVGFVQCSPNYCEKCGAHEMGMNFKAGRELTRQERQTSWYMPLDEVAHGEYLQPPPVRLHPFIARAVPTGVIERVNG